MLNFHFYLASNALKPLIFPLWNELAIYFNVKYYFENWDVECDAFNLLTLQSHYQIVCNLAFCAQKTSEITKKKNILNCLEEFQKSKKKRKAHFFASNFTCFTVKIQNWLHTAPLKIGFACIKFALNNVLWYKIYDKWIYNKLNLNRIDW